MIAAGGDGGSLKGWRVAQVGAWLLGAALLLCLVVVPPLGLRLFWNLLIPVAPALLVIGPGIWRNVCPLATTNLLPRRLGWSRQRRPSPRQSGLLGLGAVLALYAIVPLRHLVFNHDGRATALLLVAVGVASTTLGLVYDWKSAWCSGLCPVGPVERLYGGNVALTVVNAQCVECANCSRPCPDATPNFHPGVSGRTPAHRLAALLITGGLPGFIWGWFHVADGDGAASLGHALSVFALPLSGLAVTLTLYLALSRIVPARHQRRLVATFAAAAVSCYYWYRLPALFGLGALGDDGLLLDLRAVVSAPAIRLATLGTAAFFFYWLVGREPNRRSWLVRPPYALRQSAE